MSEKLRFKPYYIAVTPEQERTLEHGIRSCGFFDFIVCGHGFRDRGA